MRYVGDHLPHSGSSSFLDITHVVEMLVEMSPGFFSSFARRSSMGRRCPNGDLLFLRETAAEQLLQRFFGTGWKLSRFVS